MAKRRDSLPSFGQYHSPWNTERAILTCTKWSLALSCSGPTHLCRSRSIFQSRHLSTWVGLRYDYDLSSSSLSPCDYIAGDHYRSSRTGANSWPGLPWLPSVQAQLCFPITNYIHRQNRFYVWTILWYCLSFAVGLDDYTRGRVYPDNLFEHQVRSRVQSWSALAMKAMRQ